MEQYGEGLAKKLWQIVRVAFFMLKKGICKRKMLLDLNIMMKRGKLAGKAIHNLMFHHHPDHRYPAASDEYEFSCSNTPLYRHYFNKKKSSSNPQVDIEAVNKVLEMVLNNDGVEGSPCLPGLGFGRSPVTQQLRITDSPFANIISQGSSPAQDQSRVDEAAEDFINKFYSQLKQQKYC